MVTDRSRRAAADDWDAQWAVRSPLFQPLRTVSRDLAGHAWPDVDALNELLRRHDPQIVNAAGVPICFVQQTDKPDRFEDGFEPRAFLRGEVLVRPQNWHDLFNALVWITFPRIKAQINARHYAALTAQAGKRRSAEGDALTIFDEDGMVVLSADAELLNLLRQHRWKALFVSRRELVRARMRFLIFGHAMYEKALNPFVGMTAKCVLMPVSDAALGMSDMELRAEIDMRLSEFVSERSNLQHGKSLAPLPVLGVPGWWPANEDGTFYDLASYFRPLPDDRNSPGSSALS